MNDKDSKLLWEAYNNVRNEPINELNIPSPNNERSAANLPKWSEFKALRAKMIDAQKNLPVGLGQQMSPEFIEMFTILTPKNIYWLYKEFIKMLKGDEDNRFSEIMRTIKANEERDSTV